MVAQKAAQDPFQDGPSDNNVGDELVALNSSIVANGDSASSSTSEVMAVALVKRNSTRLMVSNFDLKSPAVPTRILFSLPLSLAPSVNAVSWQYLRYSQAPVDNVFARVKEDFANAGILDSNFAACGNCFADPLGMTTNANAALELLAKNWTGGSNYVATMENNLKWRYASPESLDANGIHHNLTVIPHNSAVEVEVTLAPNEMLIFATR